MPAISHGELVPRSARGRRRPRTGHDPEDTRNDLGRTRDERSSPSRQIAQIRKIAETSPEPWPAGHGRPGTQRLSGSAPGPSGLRTELLECCLGNIESTFWPVCCLACTHTWVFCIPAHNLRTRWPDVPIRSDSLPQRWERQHCDRQKGRESLSEYSGTCMDIRAGNLLISAFSEQSKASYRFGRCRSLGRMRQRWRGRYGRCRQAAARRR
jgi:hypothetical protein